MKKLTLLCLCSLLAACSDTTQPESTASAADLKIDLVNPAITGSGQKPDSVAAVKSDSARKAAGQTEIKAPLKEDNSTILAKGAALIAKSGCTACHDNETKRVGPAYKDVAAKYPSTPANINKLVAKVISGGSGVWGDLAMIPHPQIPKADIKAMVTYVLSLR